MPPAFCDCVPFHFSNETGNQVPPQDICKEREQTTKKQSNEGEPEIKTEKFDDRKIGRRRQGVRKTRVKPRSRWRGSDSGVNVPPNGVITPEKTFHLLIARGDMDTHQHLAILPSAKVKVIRWRYAQHFQKSNSAMKYPDY
jgi:hypothetical protein